MSHPEKLTQVLGEVTVEVKAFKTNLFFYKSIGSSLTARGQRRKRNWWCLWLCQSSVPVKLQSVAMGNTYFAQVGRSANRAAFTSAAAGGKRLSPHVAAPSE